MILPLHVDLKGLPVLVIGGGPRAARWIYLLTEAGARPKVIASELAFELRDLAKAKRLAWTRRGFRPADLAGASLVVAASDDSASNRRAVRAARARKLWVVSAEDNILGNAWLPPSLRRGGLLIHFGLPGGSQAHPCDEALSSLLKRRLGRAFGREWESVWEKIRRLKDSARLKTKLPLWLRAAKRSRIHRSRF
ncbi:MAG TPA: NAD(P)-dependent oxidoreductase [bacterium]|nr:NAD(P)-dependent oxidoreductase [bacterium]